MDVQIEVPRKLSAGDSGLDPRGGTGTAAPSTTVAGSSPATEVSSVIGEQQWQGIWERSAAGMKVSRIARELDLDRKTVRSALRCAAWVGYRREAPASGLLEAHRGWLEKRAPQVHYSAQLLYQELKGEQGFTGGYKTVQRAVRPLRAAAAAASLTQRRFKGAPGEQAQSDWGQVTVSLAGVRSKLHVFVMTPRPALAACTSTTTPWSAASARPNSA